MQVTYPVSTKILTEARLYAQDSIQHTMDYEGWKDQHKKQERITYGKFGQLWVSEFCRLNNIPHKKDRSSPMQADDLDLTIFDKKIDVKTTVCNALVGQVSPGVINKPCDEYCFLVTDRQCSYVTPIGFVSQSDYKAHSVFVAENETIPGTNLRQRFGGGSYFLPPNSPVLRPFVRELLSFMNTESEKHDFPIMLIEASEMTACIERISALEQVFIAKEKTDQAILQELIANGKTGQSILQALHELHESNRMLLKLQYQSSQKPIRRGNVITGNFNSGNLNLETPA